ncbi:tetratricopeptide repeat protein [Chryseobacterium sp. JM1]|uniref:tetratricopeptide repeat protein n=1 Tax=Chryseobacterium sp. JM1 TaxID=1233950 RepID=UPI000A6EF9A9|nr:tetratricopeptide repeat protein [Chryseobacterium sp. JM1]
MEVEQIPHTYDLLLFNNDEYDFITIRLNYMLANQFEKYSPQISKEFLNKATVLSENTKEKFSLPLVYAFKGALYYRAKNYQEAIVYYKKGLEKFSSNHKNLVLISSMHNNIGLAYENMGKLDLAVKEMQMCVQILERIKNRNTAQQDFLVNVKANIGFCYYKLKKYDLAESLLLEEFDFNKNKNKNDFTDEDAENIVELFNLYHDTEQNAKMQELMNYGMSIESEMKNIPGKILINEMFQSYYLKTNDREKLEKVSKRLIELHAADDRQKQKEFNEVSGIMSKYIIKELNLKQKVAMDHQKFNNKLAMAAAGIFIIILGWTIYFIRNSSKREKELAEKEKIILIKNKRILEQDVKEQEEKITRMHLNLNLKVETERTFLEYIKKIKKTKNGDSEQTINELFIRINNLIQIDKSNIDLVSESSAENRQLIKKLSAEFPDLTNNEIKFCIYYKLDLSSKEIAILENITEGSARVYKTKIKAKMNIGKEANLNLFLKNM